MKPIVEQTLHINFCCFEPEKHRTNTSNTLDHGREPKPQMSQLFKTTVISVERCYNNVLFVKDNFAVPILRSLTVRLVVSLSDVVCRYRDP